MLRRLVVLLTLMTPLLAGCVVERWPSMDVSVLPDEAYPTLLPMEEWRAQQHSGIVLARAVQTWSWGTEPCVTPQFEIHETHRQLVLSEREWGPPSQAQQRAASRPGILLIEMYSLDRGCVVHSEVRILALDAELGASHPLRMPSFPLRELRLMDQWSLDVSGERIEPGERYHMEYRHRLIPSGSGQTNEVRGTFDVRFVGAIPVENIRVEQREHKPT